MSETDSENQILQKLESIESRLDRLEEGGSSTPSSQPDSKLKVWNDDDDVPASPEVAQVVKQVLSQGRIGRGTVQTIIDRSKTRSLEVMRELGSKHPDIACRKKSLGRNRGLFLYKDRDNSE